MSIEPIPADWDLCQLVSKCRVVSGSTPKTAVEEYWGGDISWITPNDLSKNRSKYVSAGERFLTAAGYDSCSTQLVPSGSVLFTSRAPIGYVAIASREVCTNQGLKTAVPGESLSSEFLYWQLQYLVDDIRSRASGTTFLEISGKGFGATQIVVPSLAEQTRIVEILEEQLSRLDAAVKSVQAVREEATQFRRALLHAAFTGALTQRDSGSMRDASLPTGWAEKPLKEVAGFSPKAPIEGLKTVEEVSFLPMAAVSEVSGKCDLSQTITPKEGKRRNLTYFEDADIIFAKITPCMENGKIARPIGLVGGRGFGSTEFHVLRPNSSIVGEYLRFFLVHDDFRINAERAMTGAVGQRRVPRKYLEEHPIPVPPIREQERIVEILEEQLSRLDATLAVADEVERKANALRRSLLHAAFTGELTRSWREAHV